MAPEKKPLLEFDPSITLSYGYWRCDPCGSRFYGGGPAIHDKKDCPNKDKEYTPLVYCFGPKEVRDLLLTRGNAPLCPRILTFQVLAEFFPYLLEATSSAKK